MIQQVPTSPSQTYPRGQSCSRRSLFAQMGNGGQREEEQKRSDPIHKCPPGTAPTQSPQLTTTLRKEVSQAPFHRCGHGSGQVVKHRFQPKTRAPKPETKL